MPRPDWILRAADGRRPPRIAVSRPLWAGIEPGRDSLDLTFAPLHAHVEWVSIHTDLSDSGLCAAAASLHPSQLDGIVLNAPQATIDAVLQTPLPLPPVITIAEFKDASVRRHFVERVVAHHRLADLFSSDWTQGDLVSFHSAYKLTLMSHSQRAYRRLGRLVADAATRRQKDDADEYARDLMTTLRIPTTPGNHVNVLQHVLGYFKRVMDGGRRAELLDMIQRYAAGELSLDVLCATMNRHVREFDIRYLSGQTYLNPHPAESAIHEGASP